MKWVLNTQKGNTINHPAVGNIEGGKAYQITDEQANQLKHIYNVVIFDEVVQKKVV